MFRQRLGEAEKELLEGTEIVPGTDIYAGDQGSLDLGGRQVEFHTFGTAQGRIRNSAEGRNVDELVTELKPQIRATYSTWEHDRFIEPAIRFFAQA